MDQVKDLFLNLVEELLEAEKDDPVVRSIPAEMLYESLDLNLPEEETDFTEYEQALKELVLATPRTASSSFFNQLFGGRNQYAVLGDLLAVLLNNSMYTYKVAGPQVGVEKVIINKLCDIIGWDKGSGGTFAAGGSMTNFMSMLMARDRKDNKTPYRGAKNGLTVYTSEESHYSIPKNAAFCGIGRDQVRYIPTDKYGAMIPEKLQSQILEDLDDGYIPALINLTAGTTVMGAFDPIKEISTISKEFNVWLHVDGAYCGAVLLSESYKHLINGIEEVDSFSFNAHKMLCTPLSCSLILVKDKENLYRSFENNAEYLYQTDHDDFNLGKISLQCGRRNDALKFWSLWKKIGTKGLGEMVDKQFELADIARNYVRNNDDYTLYSYDDSISICFNYKDIPAEEICSALYDSAELLVGYGEFQDVQFIRLVTVNPNNSEKDILRFFEKLESFTDANLVGSESLEVNRKDR